MLIFEIRNNLTFFLQPVSLSSTLPFFVFGLSSLPVPSLHHPFSLFLTFLFCSSDGSETISLPSWLDMDSMSALIWTFFYGHAHTYGHTSSHTHTHTHTQTVHTDQLS